MPPVDTVTFWTVVFYRTRGVFLTDMMEPSAVMFMLDMLLFDTISGGELVTWRIVVSRLTFRMISLVVSLTL